MTHSDEDIGAALREVIRCSEVARRELEATEDALRHALAYVEEGGSVTAGLRSFPVATRREATQSGIEQMVKSRHDLRLAVIALATADGIGPRELSEIWGVSRQRIDQYLQELKKRGAADRVGSVTGVG
jgi:hypothetical protein